MFALKHTKLFKALCFLSHFPSTTTTELYPTKTSALFHNSEICETEGEVPVSNYHTGQLVSFTLQPLSTPEKKVPANLATTKVKVK
jgi:hypothetical protein